MRKPNWRLLLLLPLILSLFLGVSALAEELTPGVTVTEDPSSPTGYYVTFVYEDANATEVFLNGTFAFYRAGTAIGVMPPEFIRAADWEPGMFRASSTDLAAAEPMVKAEGTDFWTITLALPSGHYL